MRTDATASAQGETLMQPLLDARGGGVEARRADLRLGAAGDAVARYSNHRPSLASMTRDQPVWRVAPAPDGRAIPDEYKPKEHHESPS